MKILDVCGRAEMKKEIREMLDFSEDEEKTLRDEGTELIIPTPYLRRIYVTRKERLVKNAIYSYS